MKGFWNIVQFIFMSAAKWSGWFLGGYDNLLFALCLFIIADYITGITCAILHKKFIINVGFNGIVKKSLIFLLVGVSNTLDVQVIINTGPIFRTATIYFYISNEGLSLLKNVKYLGLPIPEKLKEILEKLYEK